MMHKKISILLLAVMPLFVNAQKESKEVDITCALTGNIYQGDLTPSILGSSKDLKIGFQGMVRYHLKGERIYLRGSLNIASLKGDDAQFDSPEWTKHRNYSFSTSLIDLSAMLEFNLFHDDKKFQPYVAFGFGFAKINPKKDASKLDTAYFAAVSSEQIGLVKEQSMTQPKLLVTIPASIGFRYKLNATSSLFVEACYKTCISDYLDGFSLSVRSQKFDAYSVYALGYTFKLSTNKKK